MFLRLSLAFLYLSAHFLSLSSNVESAQSCADIIRPSQKYLPNDPSLTIGTLPTYTYQTCGNQCRMTTLCRTAVWCHGQCTMYQEYFIFGKRTADLNCMLITFSGMAFNEIEPTVSILRNVLYEESQSKYYEHTYKVNDVDECIQLCRLDAHCLTASYHSSENFCSLFAEHISQGRNSTNVDWTTIGLDTCAGRDPQVYPCLIDATQANEKFCDLLSQMQPVPLKTVNQPMNSNGFTGWLTRSSIYWPTIVDGQSSIFRASFDMKSIERFLSEEENAPENERYLHVNIDQRSETPLISILSKSSIDNEIHRISLKERKTRSSFSVGRSCHWCYFANDGSNVSYVSMDERDSIERYENQRQTTLPIYISSPAGLIVRNHHLWLVNDSQLIQLETRRSFDQTLTYFLANHIDLATLANQPALESFLNSDGLTFLPFHLDVDHYGRVYVAGALINPWIGEKRSSPGHNQKIFILADGYQRLPTIVCVGSWAMFGVNVYHSKVKLRMLTSTDRMRFHFYSAP